MQTVGENFIQIDQWDSTNQQLEQILKLPLRQTCTEANTAMAAYYEWLLNEVLELD